MCAQLYYQKEADGGLIMLIYQTLAEKICL